MPFENNGISTYYEDYGDSSSPTLLLLHGIGADHNMWSPQKQVYPSEGYRVIIPDLLGHGQSSKVKSLELSDWSVQLYELIRFLKISKVTLVGVSMGGVIAQHFVVQHPDLVERIVIADSFGELKTIRERLLGYSQIIGFKIFKLIGSKALAKGMSSTYKADHAYLARRYFSKISMNIDLDQMILARKAINQIDVLEQLRSIDMPRLVMAGDGFGQFFININKKIAKAMNTPLVILKDSMDPSNLVKPDEFNKKLLDFLNA